AEPRGDRLTFQPRRAVPWLLPLAATLVAALLGVSAWLWTRLDEQSERIARLTRQVQELREARSGSAGDARLAALEEYLRIVSTPGVEVCPLRLTAVEAASGQARGILYVAPDHQHWYLALSGLRPAPQGQAYHLWFFVADRPVSAGSFEARPGELVRLGSDTMPEGTHAVGITLEPSEDVEQPSSEPILFGDEVMRVA
ncbi:MAG: anti-sigma factor, partial [Thermoanaerobaculia bacterium]